MPNIRFRDRPTRIDPEELRRRLADALPTIEVDVADGTVRLSWHDGPAVATVAEVVAEHANWPLEPHRTFSDEALAVAVVRYQASHVRPYDSSRPDAVAGLRDLLEVDDPARSGYPVPDAVADLLLQAPDPDDLVLPADATRADELAAKLTALGYDRLWAVAWKELA